MSDQLSSDLASLKIDRSTGAGSRALPSRAWLRGLLVLGVLAVLGGAYALAKPYLEARVFKSEVALTEITLSAPAQTTVELTASGYVKPQVVSRVGAKIPGRVSRVYARQGDQVKAGALLLELERADREASLHAARMRTAAALARVATARANSVEVRQQARRQRQLAQQGVAPAANAEDLEARAASLQEAVAAAEAEVKAGQAEENSERVNLKYMTVLAPIDGTITSKAPEVGELIGMDGFSVNENELEMADFSTLMVETDIPEGRLHLVKIGSPCEIVLDAFPGKRYRGEAVKVDPRVDRAKATVGVKVRFVDSSEGVLPDMSARVSFLSKALDEAALTAKAKRLVPASALADRGGAKVVFVFEGEKVRMRAVRLGERLGGSFELLEGPDAGTRVVSQPAPTLADGHGVKEKG